LRRRRVNCLPVAKLTIKVKAAANLGVRQVEISIAKEAVVEQPTVKATRAIIGEGIVRI